MPSTKSLSAFLNQILGPDICSVSMEAFSVKGQIVNILGSASQMDLVASIWFCCWRAETAIDKYIEEWLCSSEA
jgi:hypothetical protein